MFIGWSMWTAGFAIEVGVGAGLVAGGVTLVLGTLVAAGGEES